MSGLKTVLSKVTDTRKLLPPGRGMLIALTGIDGCGKGYITSRIVNALRSNGICTAGINIDGWLNLPNIRYSKSNPAEHYYNNAICFDEMFDQFVLPLRDKRSVSIEFDFVEETATEYRKQFYSFKNIDVILLEGIYLLETPFRHYYVLSYWIECSFETALDRAISRAQEGLSPEEPNRAYKTSISPHRKSISN